MQMLHPHRGSIQQYMEQIEDPDHGRPSSNRQDGEGSLDAEPDLEGSRAGSAASAGAVLGAPFFQTGRAAIGGAGRIDGSERGSEFCIQGSGYAGEDRMDGGAPVSVFRP